MHWVKAAGAKPGQSLLLRLTGALETERLVTVGADGRGRLVEGSSDPDDGTAGDPTTVIVLDWADLVARACGRDGAARSPVWLDGDEAMGQAVLDALPMSP